MTGREKGFLLLTSQLGNPERKVLTPAQLRVLAQRSKEMRIDDPNRDLRKEDLLNLGYSGLLAERIVALLEEKELLEYYCIQGRRAGCVPLTRVTAGYPQTIRNKLGLDSPGVLWAKGDLEILERPKIALVGSRDLQPKNLRFAKEVGRQAALQGYVLVSGNARGADQAAQEACLAAGGQVISVVADTLKSHKMRENVVYLSEDGFEQGFSAQRAISRNRCLHCLGEKVFVAQCGYQTGGTWDGTVKNLRFGWSPVFMLEDDSPASELLSQMGASLMGPEELRNIAALPPQVAGLFSWEGI